jgi:hypothetical protein
MPFGRLRYINETRNLKLAAFSPYKYIDHRTWSLDIDLLISDFSRASGLSVDEIRKAYAAAPTPDPWKLIHGHDAEAILHIGLCAVFSNISTSKSALSSGLRIAFDKSLLKMTEMWRRLKEWEATFGLVIVTD